MHNASLMICLLPLHLYSVATFDGFWWKCSGKHFNIWISDLSRPCFPFSFFLRTDLSGKPKYQFGNMSLGLVLNCWYFNNNHGFTDNEEWHWTLESILNYCNVFLFLLDTVWTSGGRKYSYDDSINQNIQAFSCSKRTTNKHQELLRKWWLWQWFKSIYMRVHTSQGWSWLQ